jgi:DNA-binding response OmpR family regulator
MIADTTGRKRVLVIDRQSYWRRLSARALEERGFTVKALSTYDYLPETAYFDGEPPDLVVLGCASIKREERELIELVLTGRSRLLVFCASLPWRDARSVFLAGADDVVADKPYDPEQLVHTVDEVFKSRGIRDSYQAEEYKGAL